MNFREVILNRIIELLTRLIIPSTASVLQANGQVGLIPNEGYGSPLNKVVVGPLEEVPATNPADIPIAFVTFDGGALDLTAETYLSHIIENLSIRITLLLSTKIAAVDGEQLRDMEFQASDYTHDIQQLVNLTSLQSAVHVLEDDVVVNEVVLEEWGFDDQFRGGELEVLSLVFQASIAKPRNPT